MHFQSKKISYILLLFCFIKGFGFNNNSEVKPLYAQLDSVIQNEKYQREKFLEKALNYYTRELSSKKSDSTLLLRKIALSYAELNNAKEAAVYADLYIKKALDISILNNSVFEKIKASPEFLKLEERYMPKIGYMSLFYVFTSFIGLFLAFVINFKKRGNRIGNFLISVFVFLHSLFIINSALYVTNYMYKFPQTLFITLSFSYLYGPLLYFYFKSITENYSFKVIDLLHLLPTLAMLLYATPVYLLSLEEKLSFMINTSNESPSFIIIFIVLTKFLSLAIYTYAIHKIYLKNKKRDNWSFSIALKWQFILKNISIAYVITYLLYGYAGLFMPYVTAARHPQILIMSLSILSIAVAAYVNPELFSNIKKQNSALLGNKKYQKSGLTHNLSIELKHDLIRLFDDEKIYKNGSINLGILANKLGTTRHSASQIINEHFNMNFFELINKFRIKEAIKILEEDTNGNLHIIDVAYEVGYNNKVTFNKAFKKETSLTPSEYLQNRANYKPQVNFP